MTGGRSGTGRRDGYHAGLDVDKVIDAAVELTYPRTRGEVGPRRRATDRFSPLPPHTRGGRLESLRWRGL